MLSFGKVSLIKDQFSPTPPEQQVIKAFKAVIDLTEEKKVLKTTNTLTDSEKNFVDNQPKNMKQAAKYTYSFKKLEGFGVSEKAIETLEMAIAKELEKDRYLHRIEYIA